MRWILTVLAVINLGCALDAVEGGQVELSGEPVAAPTGVTPPQFRGEICNGKDDDGDGRVDNGMLAVRWMPDTANVQIRVGRNVQEWSQVGYRRQYNPSGLENAGWVESEPMPGARSYDKQGNMLVHWWVGLDGKHNKYLFHYDHDGDENGLTYLLCEGDMSSCEYELEVFDVLDADGHVVMTSYNHYVLPERTLVTQVLDVYTYAADGRKTSSVRTLDEDADGNPESGSALYFNYDADGLLEEMMEDKDLDGAIDLVQTTQWDESGRVVTVSKDNGADGTIDQQTVSTHDDQGNLLEVADDQDADGTVDHLTTYTYDHQGTMMTSLAKVLVDRLVVRAITTTYDLHGDRLMRTDEVDQDFDGVLELSRLYASTYDNRRNRLTHLDYRDSDKDGTFDVMRDERFIYNDDDHLVSRTETVDRDGNGTVDQERETTYMYGLQGNLVTSSYHHYDNAKGTVNSLTTNYTVACHGRK